MRTSPASPLTPHRRGCAVAAVVALLLAFAAVPALAQEDSDADGACTPELVTHTTEGTTGVEGAVAITSQAVDRGVEGWSDVGWQAAEGAALTGLTVTELDGAVSTYTADIDSGFLEDVAELRFCGSYDGAVSVQPEAPVEDDEGTDDGGSGSGGDGAGSGGDGGSGDDGGTDDGSTGGGTDGSTGGSGDDGGSGSAGGSDDDTSGGEGSGGSDDDDNSGDGDDGPVVVTVPAPDEELDLGDEEAAVESSEDDGFDADADEDAAGNDVTDDATEDDTEVLGVQLTRDDPDPGGVPAWLIGAGVVVLGLLGFGAFRLRHAIR